MTRDSHDAVVVGSGPNGLMAAITLGRAGVSTLLLEAEDEIGGACRSGELTLPGFIHDYGAAVPLFALAAPAMRSLDLASHGAEFVHARYPFAHPLDDGAVFAARSVDETADALQHDGEAYRRLMHPVVGNLEPLLEQFLGPLLRPSHYVRAARFGLAALQPVTMLARRFAEPRARALLAGLGAHSVLPLQDVASSAAALLLGATAHAVGWPVVRGGSSRLTAAMAAVATEHGVRVQTGCRVRTLRDLPEARVRLLDVTPRQLLSIAGDALPPRYARALQRYRYAPGAFKVDWALDGPIPWRAQECSDALTVHVCGTLEAVADAEADVARGRHPGRPFLLLVQPTIADATRAPRGKHTAWAYCHVPNGSTFDMTARVEAQVDRFAPGFRERILARSMHTPDELERFDANCVGGDIGGGLQDLWQTLARPVLSLDPYRTPVPGLFLCSASTPPGGGVHGMCGYHAAKSALRRLRRA